MSQNLKYTFLLLWHLEWFENWFGCKHLLNLCYEFKLILWFHHRVNQESSEVSTGQSAQQHQAQLNLIFMVCICTTTTFTCKGFSSEGRSNCPWQTSASFKLHDIIFEMCSYSSSLLAIIVHITYFFLITGGKAQCIRSTTQHCLNESRNTGSWENLNNVKLWCCWPLTNLTWTVTCHPSTAGSNGSVW